MTLEITQEAIKALNAEQFEQVKGWVRDDDKARVEKHKQETLAQIRELARSAHIGIRIEGTRGRPAKRGADASGPKTASH
jgi:hypothetical protein